MLENLPPLTNETIWDILGEKIDDETVNKLVWYHLGYRYNHESQTWDNSKVEDSWKRISYSPDFIANRPPNVKLTRSIPKEKKAIIKRKIRF